MVDKEHVWFVAGVHVLSVGRRETVSSSVINLSVVLELYAHIVTVIIITIFE